VLAACELWPRRAAKFSAPFNIAVAFVMGGAGFEAFTEKTVRDPRILALASKVRYIVDPNNPTRKPTRDTSR
jgi:2-methylcitrate dehydratase PrpD